MPLTLRTQQWPASLTGLQSQSESEQSAHTWSQSLWLQEKPEDEINWMKTNKCGPDDEMDPLDPKRNEPLAFPPGGLTIPPTSGSSAWAIRHIQQPQQGAQNRLPQPTESFDDWATPDFWQSSLLDDLPPPSGKWPISLAVHNSPTLPSFVGNVDYKNDEPFSTTSGSLSPVFDEGNTTYELGGTTEAALAGSLVKRSPSSKHRGIAEDFTKGAKPKGKRGRPRLLRDQPSTHDAPRYPSTQAINESSASRCVPHNQVEQKYRNGLNAGLVRLREAVSTRTHHNSDSAKLSKAMVLTSAIECIKAMEEKRDELQAENKGLKRRSKRLRRD